MFQRKLKRSTWRTESDKGPWQILRRAWLPVTFNHSCTGVIVGVRTLANGTYNRGGGSYEDYEPPELVNKEYLKAYLVAYDMRRRPVLVLPEDMT